MNKIILSVFILMQFSAFGQSWVNYDSTNSPVISGAFTICFTKNHYAWVALDQYMGVAIYDHGKWVQKDFMKRLEHVSINAIAEDKDGSVWFAGSNGLFHLIDTNWVQYTISNSPLKTNSIRDLAIDTNNVKWMTSESGLYSYDGTNWKHFTSTNSGLTNNYTTLVSIDAQNRIWVTSFDGKINIFDGLNWLQIDSTHIPESQIPYFSFTDSRNRLWIFGQDNNATGAIYTLTDSVWTRYSISTPYGYNFSSPESICESSDGSIWIGGYDGAINIRDDGTKVYSRREGMNQTHVYKIAEDPDSKDIWMCALTGISVLKRTTGLEEGINISSILRYTNPVNNDLWIYIEDKEINEAEINDLRGINHSYGLNEFRKNASEFSIDTHFLADGMYILRLSFTDGTTNFLKVLVRHD